MANPFLKLNLRRPISDGTYPIVIAIGNGRDLYLSTGVYADKDTGWDTNARQCVGPGAKQKNAVLATILAQTINRIIQLKEEGQFESLSNKELKTLLTDPDSKVAEVKKANKPTLHGLFPKVAATKNKRSQELYHSTLKKVEDFCQPSEARLDDINKMWLDNFCARYSHLAANTLSIHLRNIRAVINYAIDCDLTTNYPFRRYSIPKSPIKKKAVPVETIRKLANAKLPDHLCKWRDAMMLMFCLAGINIGDMCNLKEIAEGRVDYQRAKTHKPYSIKVEPEAIAYIEKLKGVQHLLYILDKHTCYRTYYRQLRRGLEAIKKELHLSELTTYTMRHSWATIARSSA